MHPDLDALMRIKIYGRKQQKNESFHDYHNEVESMFRSMQYQLPEFEKVQILKQNMRTDYKKQLTFVPKQTLSILVNAARMLDAHSFPAYNKVFGLERNVHAVSTTNQSNKKKQKESAGETVNAVGQPARPPQNQNNRNQQRPSTSTPQQQQQQQAGPSGSNTQRPQGNHNGQSGQPPRPTMTLDDLVNAHAPPPENSCFNCGRAGHHFVMCRQQRALFCGNCGLRGFPAEHCPYCLKNANAANQNRRS